MNFGYSTESPLFYSSHKAHPLAAGCRAAGLPPLVIIIQSAAAAAARVSPAVTSRERSLVGLGGGV